MTSKVLKKTVTMALNDDETFGAGGPVMRYGKKSNATRKELRRAVASGWSAPNVDAALDAHERTLWIEALEAAERRIQAIIRGAYDSRDWDAACDTIQRNLREMATFVKGAPR